jgi:hypothetical protein
VNFDWCSRTELNRDQLFRKQLLCPFELREHNFEQHTRSRLFAKTASLQSEMGPRFTHFGSFRQVFFSDSKIAVSFGGKKLFSYQQG